MRDVPGNTTDTTDDTRRRGGHPAEAGDPAGDGRDRFTRRRALAAVGTLSLGMTAGCLDSVPFVGSSRVEVEPEAPGDDPDASPEEFYYILEDNGITVDELYFDTDDNDLILFYESNAEDRTESEEEIGLIYVLFRDGLVDRGSTVNHLYTEVVDGFDGQVEGWGVNAEWAEDDLSGEKSELDIWNAIINTMVYPDGESPWEEDEDDPDGGLEDDEQSDADLGADDDTDGEDDTDGDDDSDEDDDTDEDDDSDEDDDTDGDDDSDEDDDTDADGDSDDETDSDDEGDGE